jgi:hypothetical protein
MRATWQPRARRTTFVVVGFCLPALVYTIALVAIQGLLCLRPGVGCAFGGESNALLVASTIAAGIFAYAIVVELVVGWPAVLLLRRAKLARIGATCTLGAVLGLTPYLVQCLLGGSCSGMPPDLLFVGGLAGALAGASLVLVQNRQWKNKKAT